MLKPLVLGSVVAVYLLLLLGSIVSSTGSGLGCGPDWPLCRGQLIPSFSEPAVFIEWFHRLIAGFTGIFVLLTTFVAWKRAPSIPPMSALGGSAVLLLLAQVILGAITVRLELPKEVSTTHLAVGTALFAVLIVMSTLAFHRGGSSPTFTAKNPQMLVWLAAVVTFAQMVLGAYVRHSGAGLACPDIFLCLGLPHRGPVLIQLLHRVGALVVLVLVHAAGGRTLRAAQDPALRNAAVTAMVAVLIQIGLGMLSVATLLSTHATTAHLGVALILLGTLVFMGTRMALSARVPTAAAQEAAR